MFLVRDGFLVWYPYPSDLFVHFALDERAFEMVAEWRMVAVLRSTSTETSIPLPEAAGQSS